MNLRSCTGILVGAAFLSVASTAPVFATPPSNIKLTYDAEKKNLHVEMRHVTKNPRKHFIRKIFVYKNGQPVQDFSYVQQQTATTLGQDVLLEAVTGDVVRVEAVCNEAGRKDETLVIP